MIEKLKLMLLAVTAKKFIGLSKIRMNADEVRGLEEPLLVMHNNQPVAVLIPYPIYETLQRIHAEAQEIIESTGKGAGE